VKALLNIMTMNKVFKMTGFIVPILIFSVLVMSSCNLSKKDTQMANVDEYYTCSMDPQVIEYHSGICPICHMELIKVKKNTLKSGQIKLSKQQIKLANITVDTLRMGVLAKEIILTGKVTIDQNLTDAISARVQGRIEKLSINNIGEFITKGQLLYEIYSEDLNAAQQEFLLALQKNNFTDGFLNASKNKLHLYGMSDEQIAQLKNSNKLLWNVPIYSTRSGFVTELSVSEGEYVAEGTTLFKLAAYNSLWVEAQVYLPYLPFIKIGTQADFLISAAREKAFSGRVIFIDPQVQSPDRYVLARFQVTNSFEQIKPGMLANITIQTEKKISLTLPIDAVIQDSKGTNVWVRNADGIFENKKIVVGMQNSREFEILDGLEKGELVVITGAYLLNSEYIFKKGVNPLDAG